MARYIERIQAVRNHDYGKHLRLNQATDCGAYWRDDDSPTGFSQVCSYIGTCEYPCNGDC